MYYNVTLTQTTTIVVEADNMDEACEWAQLHTPLEIAKQYPKESNVSYDEYVEGTTETANTIIL